MCSQSDPKLNVKGKLFTPECRKLYFLFISVNIFIFIVALLIPARAKSEDYLFVSVINILFISLVFLLSFFIYKIKVKKKNQSFTVRQKQNVKRNVFFCSVSSLIGLALVAYDRIFIRGIDYLQGLRAARYEWLASDGGSFVSMLGNILIPFSYVGLFLIVVNSKFFKATSVFMFLVFLLAVVFGHAALNGGRSNILLAIVIMLIAFSLKEDSIKIKVLAKVFLIILFFFLPTFFYVSEIIKSSASMGGVNMSELLLRAIDSLQGELIENYSVQDASELELISLYIFSYLVHGQWTAQAIADLSSMPGSYFLYPFSVILTRLSIINEPLGQGVFSDVGAFVSLPAAMYYDFGFFGLIFFSALIGVFLGVCLSFLRNRSSVKGWKLGLIIYFSFIVFLSPIIPAYGFSYLNFIVFSFFVTGLLNRVFFGKRYRLI
jgi:oligosaccharide repeat unit polymerase